MKAQPALDPFSNLLPQHRKIIEESALSTEVAAARGYRSVTKKAELKSLGFSDAQCRVPALLIPVYGVTGDIVTYQARPDFPRISKKTGKPLKYETPADSHIRLDVPSAARGRLADPSIPLFVTEGARKADAAISKGLCCIALLGVWNWRGSNDYGGKTALADWEYVALNGRKVYIVFDSDVMEKDSVRAALSRLKGFLETRSAQVMLIYLPSGDGGAKVGLDDFFAIGHSVDDLMKFATSKLHRSQTQDDDTTSSRFAITQQGVYAIDEESGEKIWICSQLYIEADTRDDHNERWGRRLRIIDPDEQEHFWTMPMSLLGGDGKECREKLLDLGLVIAPGRKARNLLETYLNTRPKTKARCADRVGWNRGSYVLPDETIGGNGGEGIFLQSATIADHLLRVSGSVGEWRENVGHFCAGNSRLAFSISAAFASPLLNLIGEESGGFHFKGGSSLGKTTCQYVGGSVWGGGSDKGYLKRWRATANGLESVAEFHNDGFLCLDELAECDPKVADEVAYMLANGQGKIRQTRSITLRRTLEWRLLFLSSGEISLADHIAQAGKRSRGGQEVRLVNIEADAGKGFGVFEELHGFADGNSFARHLVAMSRCYYGAPIRAFLRAIIGEEDAIRQAARNFTRDFIQKHVPAHSSGEVIRVANRFALVAFGGELATSYGITNWPEGEATNAAEMIFKQWLEGRGTNGSADEEAAIRQVRAFLELHGSSRFVSDSNTRVVNRAGFKLNDDDGEIECCILPEVFRRDVCAGFDYRMVAKALLKRGYLAKADGRNYAAYRPLPELGRKRVHVVRQSIFESDMSDKSDKDI